MITDKDLEDASEAVLRILSVIDDFDDKVAITAMIEAIAMFFNMHDESFERFETEAVPMITKHLLLCYRQIRKRREES